MRAWTQERLDRTFDLILEAALKGERCPHDVPHGPLETTAITQLVAQGKISTRVSGRNYRTIVIMDGEHKGKSTKSNGQKAWRIDGAIIRQHSGCPPSIRPQPSLPKLPSEYRSGTER